MSEVSEGMPLRFARVVEELVQRGKFGKEAEIGTLIGENKHGLSDLKKGRKALKPLHVNMLLEAVPELSKSYLYEGVGEPFAAIAIPQIKNDGIPYYDMDISAGPVEMYQDNKEVPVGRIVVPGYKDCDFSINVWGDSMYPAYKNGDIIACREIKDKSVILFGEAYLVITQEFRTLKFIQKGSDRGTVILRSDNPKFDDVEIPRDAILKLYLVKGKITRDAI